MDTINNFFSNKWLVTVFLLGLALLLFFGLFISTTNHAHSLELDITQSISDKNALDNRKVTLLNNLIDVAEHSNKVEREGLAEIISLRNKAQAGENVTAQIMAVAEQYPTFKSIDNYNTVMLEMSVTENGITTQILHINSQITQYNKMFVMFPSSLFLNGYPQMGYELYNVPVTTNWKPNW